MAAERFGDMVRHRGHQQATAALAANSLNEEASLLDQGSTNGPVGITSIREARSEWVEFDSMDHIRRDR